jgi:hypothetical protein
LDWCFVDAVAWIEFNESEIRRGSPVKKIVLLAFIGLGGILASSMPALASEVVPEPGTLSLLGVGLLGLLAIRRNKRD